MLQPVPSHTWVRSLADPLVYAYQDTGHNEVVDWCADGSTRVSYPERWRFARANLRDMRWETNLGVTPGQDVLHYLLEEVGKH